jgi:ATP-dependent Lon protease
MGRKTLGLNFKMLQFLKKQSIYEKMMDKKINKKTGREVKKYQKEYYLQKVFLHFEQRKFPKKEDFLAFAF